MRSAPDGLREISGSKPAGSIAALSCIYTTTTTMSSPDSSSSASSSSDLLRDARFNTAGGRADDLIAPTSAQLLGDAAAYHPLANLNNGELDYLLLDDGKLNDMAGGQTVLPSRGWGDELCYGTGTTYLAGEPTHSYAQGQQNAHSVTWIQAYVLVDSGVCERDGHAQSELWVPPLAPLPT